MSPQLSGPPGLFEAHSEGAATLCSRSGASGGAVGSPVVAQAPQEPVVGLLAEEWRAISFLGAQLGAGDWDLPSECPGWTVRDVLAHIVGTERSLLGEPAPSDPVTAEHVHNPVGALNEAWVASRRSVPGAELLSEFTEVTNRRLDELRRMGTERFDRPGPSPIGQVPYRDFMSVRLMDCWVHEQDMRVATGRPGHGEGPVAELAMDRIASAMGYVVAKKAAAPEGSSVLFSLSGSAARAVGVVVRDGRGVLETAPEPTVVLEMDSELFWRLGCGRVSGEAALDAGLVGFKGDTELGRRVVANMAFMI